MKGEKMYRSLGCATTVLALIPHIALWVFFYLTYPNAESISTFDRLVSSMFVSLGALFSLAFATALLVFWWSQMPGLGKWVEPRIREWGKDERE